MSSTTHSRAAARLDSGLLSPVCAGTPAQEATSDTAWLQAMLDAAAGLVRAQARVGLVPMSAALTVTDAAKADRLDLAELARSARGAGNPVVRWCGN